MKLKKKGKKLKDDLFSLFAYTLHLHVLWEQIKCTKKEDEETMVWYEKKETHWNPDAKGPE